MSVETTGPVIIGISGPAGCGKDTAAFGLTSDLNDGLVFHCERQHRALADKLKSIATSLGWDGSKDKRGRQFLIDLGRSIRTYDRDYFTRQIAQAIEASPTYSTGGGVTVISDLRFYAEAGYLHYFCRGWNGVFLNLHVVRDETWEMRRVREDFGSDATESEMAKRFGDREQVPNYECLEVRNVGSKEEYQHAVRSAVYEWLGRVRPSLIRSS